jgi:SAM-dependent methyltransferase
MAQPAADRLAYLFEGSTEPEVLYETHAPLYDVFYEQHYDYDAFAAAVREHAPETVERYGSFACGTAQVLSRLESDYPDTFGVDAARGMVELARARAARSTVEQADVTTFAADPPADYVSMVGGSLFHFDPGAVRSVAESARRSLRPGGVFLVDFLTPDGTTDGYHAEHTYEVEGYTLTRHQISVVDPEDSGSLSLAFAYHVADDVGRTRAVGVREDGHVYPPETVQETLEDAGFGSIESVEPVKHGGMMRAVR